MNKHKHFVKRGDVPTFPVPMTFAETDSCCPSLSVRRYYDAAALLHNFKVVIFIPDILTYLRLPFLYASQGCAEAKKKKAARSCKLRRSDLHVMKLS